MPLISDCAAGLNVGKKVLRRAVFLALGLAISAATPAIAVQHESPEYVDAQNASTPALAPVQKTEIRDQTAYERLMNNSGVTLQWLWSDDQRGHLHATDKNDVVSIAGMQESKRGSVDINGDIVSIDKNSFLFRGTILIMDVPDQGRRCERTGDFEFKATGKRRYWRLQQMQTCDHLTDYVDIYY